MFIWEEQTTTEGEKREIRTGKTKTYCCLCRSDYYGWEKRAHLLKRSGDVITQLKVKEISFMDAVVDGRRRFEGV